MSQFFFLSSWTGLNFNKWLNFDSIFYREFLLAFFGLKKDQSTLISRRGEIWPRNFLARKVES